MKKVIFSAIVMATILLACNSNNKPSEQNATTETSTTDASNEQMYACPMHPEVTGKKGAECSKCGMELTEPVAKSETTHDHNDGTHEHNDSEKEKTTTENETSSTPFSMESILKNYLDLKNALTKDDSKATANAGKQLFATLKNVDMKTVPANKNKDYMDIAESAKENAEHIGDNAGKIDHQREHFASLSKDVNDLIKMFGSKQRLYQDFCPMYDDGKGAIWISETKDIKNPYYGTKMIGCGSLKKEL